MRCEGCHSSSPQPACAVCLPVFLSFAVNLSHLLLSHVPQGETVKEKERGPLGGVMGGFLDLLVYCANGALATDLDKRCKEAYR